MFGSQAVTRQSAQFGTLPAPTRGIDSSSPLINIPPEFCIYTYNLVATEHGCTVRKGTVEWANGLGGAVRTLIPFGGGLPTAAAPKLFAVTAAGIYEVTDASTENPTIAYAFPKQSSGLGTYVNYTNDNGDHRILYADSLGGYYEYTPSSDTWGPVTGLTGAVTDSTTVNTIIHHKERLWLGVLNSPDGYYLGPGAYTGESTRFTLGSKYKHGGVLSSYVSWSRDSGDGLDDLLVIISTTGDVLIYDGYDPADAAYWQLVGQWYIGDVPPEKRHALELGGDVMLLSRIGVTSLNAIMRSGQGTSSQDTDLITRIVRENMRVNINRNGWAISLSPVTDSVLIQTPPGLEGDATVLNATLDPNSPDVLGGKGALSNGDMTLTKLDDGQSTCIAQSTNTWSSGEHYVEFVWDNTEAQNQRNAVGLALTGTLQAGQGALGDAPNQCGYQSRGGCWIDDVWYASFGPTWETGDIIGMYVRWDSATDIYVEFFKNNVTAGNFTMTVTAGEYHACVSVEQYAVGDADQCTVAWDAEGITYTPPYNATPWGLSSTLERNEPSIQYVFDRGRRAWSFWRDVEASCFETWQGEQYYGTWEGQVFIMRGSVDNVLITPSPSQQVQQIQTGEGGWADPYDYATEGGWAYEPQSTITVVGPGIPEAARKISWSLLTAYSQLGAPATYKIPSEIRPTFLASSTPSYQIKPLFDFDLVELTGSANVTPAGAAVWGTALWDEAVWLGNAESQGTMTGASGIGRNIAVAIKGESSVDTTLIGFDMAWRPGGWR